MTEEDEEFNRIEREATMRMKAVSATTKTQTMRTNTTASLRTLLRVNPDGLDVGTMANHLEREPSNIRKLLSTMPDAYIDRWVRQRGNPPTAVWCVVVPPDNCPKPENQRRRK